MIQPRGISPDERCVRDFVGVAECGLEDHSYLTPVYSDIMGGEGWVWASGGSFVYWDDDRIDTDPLFVAAENGDLRLQFDSPCVDAGSNVRIGQDIGDMDGDGNVIELAMYDVTGASPIERTTADMGAYEIQFGDLDCDGLIDFRDINPFVLALASPGAYAAAYPDCDLRMADLNANGEADFGDINPFVARLSTN